MVFASSVASANSRLVFKITPTLQKNQPHYCVSILLLEPDMLSGLPGWTAYCLHSLSATTSRTGGVTVTIIHFIHRIAARALKPTFDFIIYKLLPLCCRAEIFHVFIHPLSDQLVNSAFLFGLHRFLIVLVVLISCLLHTSIHSQETIPTSILAISQNVSKALILESTLAYLLLTTH